MFDELCKQIAIIIELVGISLIEGRAGPSNVIFFFFRNAQLNVASDSSFSLCFSFKAQYLNNLKN